MNLETQAAFARRIGKDRSHVTRLKQSGRLVMNEGRIDVDRTLALLKDTESPLPRDQANRERLAAERAQSSAPGAVADDIEASLADAGRRQKVAQADKMQHEAEMARMERERLEGSLVELSDVQNAGLDIAAKLRAALEGLPDRYAPELAAATDTNQAHGLLAEALELVLDELTREIAALDQVLGAR